MFWLALRLFDEHYLFTDILMGFKAGENFLFATGNKIDLKKIFMFPFRLGWNPCRNNSY